ncbi:hypothetical protein LEP1GSC021_1644 [Leptospira noguchii str. 1993005606]|uniref:Leucine rich repeat protein n=3 Tax=Leptospira noguchii TaxID=28182 RepID=M6Y533_9LEPT|nr:hypothetical protein [Leptospira noguchii]EMN01826.1 hypothetical protein LEP1GSC035_1781 [Leptospira noguchii str. 2007001578]EMO88815.1 hypothetical protein LEP1GSC024_0096 [Leptospira noguchii str. 2001034031]EPE83442.1 hypothetical protein LEP1GSC021_1644 [Leptospira noguchii str. 1993005606]
MTFLFYLETCFPIQIKPNQENLYEISHNTDSFTKIFFLFFDFHFFLSFSFMQAEEVEQERYTDLTKALQNPLDVLILDLNGDELTTLPKEIGQLENLRELRLGNNQLSFEEKERIQKLLLKCKIDFEDLFIKQ